MKSFPEYSLWTPVNRPGERGGPYVVSCVIDQLSDTGWEAEMCVPHAEDRAGEAPTHTTTFSATSPSDAFTKAVEWIRPIAANVLECTPDQVVLAHNDWKQEA